jgi:SAM-dependent methyltransferase
MIKNFIKRIPFSISIFDGLKYLLRYYLFVTEYIRFSSLLKKNTARFSSLAWRERYPCLGENTGTTYFDAPYIYHPAWAARILKKTQPSMHIDISSTLNFCAIASAFVPVEFYDYRPAKLALDNLICRQGDLTQLPFEDGSVESLSCMHVVEHVGLGRYGDVLDPDGDLKAIAELKRVLASGGSLLFVTPVGKPKIRYNAHRIYSYDQVVSYFAGLQIQQFALVDDKDRFLVDANPAYANQQEYGCGCWWFKK